MQEHDHSLGVTRDEQQGPIGACNLKHKGEGVHCRLLIVVLVATAVGFVVQR